MELEDDIRGGYGLFYAPQFAIGAPISPPGYTSEHELYRDHRRLQDAGRLAQQSVSSGLTAPLGNSLGNLTAIGQSFSLVIRSRSRRVFSSSRSTCSGSCLSALRWKWLCGFAFLAPGTERAEPEYQRA